MDETWEDLDILEQLIVSAVGKESEKSGITLYDLFEWAKKDDMVFPMLKCRGLESNDLEIMVDNLIERGFIYELFMKLYTTDFERGDELVKFYGDMSAN